MSLLSDIRQSWRHHYENRRISEAILAGREAETLAEIRAAILVDSTTESWAENLKGSVCAARPDYVGDLRLQVTMRRPQADYYGRCLAVLEGRSVATAAEVVSLREREGMLAREAKLMRGAVADIEASIAAVETKVRWYRDLDALGKLAAMLPAMRRNREANRAQLNDTEADLAAVRSAITRAEVAA